MQATKYRRTNLNAKIHSENKENICSQLSQNEQTRCSLSKLPAPNQAIGLARKKNEEYGAAISLTEGVILGRVSRKRSLADSNRLCIGIDVKATGISRNQVQILTIRNDKMLIRVCDTATNPIVLQRGEYQERLEKGDSATVTIGDCITFDIWEACPIYVYKVVQVNIKPRVVKRAKQMSSNGNHSSLELINTQPGYEMSQPKLNQWNEYTKREAAICYRITISLDIPRARSVIYFQQRNPNFKMHSANNANFYARNYLKMLSKDQLEALNHEVTKYISSCNDDKSFVTKKPTKVPRIKAGVRFRISYIKNDLFGIKRKQWCYGYARSVLRIREDLFKSTNDFKHEIDLIFRDSSVEKIMFPEAGVQLLDSDCNDRVMAWTDDGVQLAYDKNVRKICLGDLVDCRVQVNQPFIRGRVAQIDHDTKSCCVVLTNHEVRSQ